MGHITNSVRPCVAALLLPHHRSIIDPVDILQNTNVVKLFSILENDDPEKQVCYYQASTRPSTFCQSLYLAERLTAARYRDLY